MTRIYWRKEINPAQMDIQVADIVNGLLDRRNELLTSVDELRQTIPLADKKLSGNNQIRLNSLLRQASNCGVSTDLLLTGMQDATFK